MFLWNTIYIHKQLKIYFLKAMEERSSLSSGSLPAVPSNSWTMVTQVFIWHLRASNHYSNITKNYSVMKAEL